MKLALILATLALSAVACSKAGYIDPDRAVQQTDEWKSVQTEAKAYAESRQGDLDKAMATLKKARDAKAPAEEILASETRAGELQQQINAEVKRRLDAGAAKIGTAMAGTLGKFAASEHISAILLASGAVWIDPELDLTARLVKHYNATGASSEIQGLRDEVAGFRAEKQKQASPPIAKK